jgi:hypothetical protein
METQWWVVLAVLVIIVAIVGYRWFSGTRSREEQERRMGVQEQSRAHSPAEEISQREDRRLAGMTAEDQAWELASLQRNRDSPEGRARRTTVSDDHL